MKKAITSFSTRAAALLALMMLTILTAQTARAQYYNTLYVESLYDQSAVSVSIEYDWDKGGYYTTLNTPYFEQQFNRSNHNIVGYGYSSTGVPTIATDATIKLTANPTTLYAFWDDTVYPHWEVSESGDILTFYSDYVMDDYAENLSPWSMYKSDITTLVINDGMTAIGNNAFNGFNHLTSVSLPNSLTSIGEDAFSFCI